jgi:hypothetical protein
MIETMYDGQFGACAAVGPATNAAVKALLKHEGKTVSATISELEAHLPEARHLPRMRNKELAISVTDQFRHIITLHRAATTALNTSTREKNRAPVARSIKPPRRP